MNFDVDPVDAFNIKEGRENKTMKALEVDWVSQESVGDCKNPDEPDCNGGLWRFTFKDGSVVDICRDCDYTKVIKERRD